MSKNKKNKKSKKGAPKRNAVAASLINRDMADFISNRVRGDLDAQRDELEGILDRIREGDASPNEIDTVIDGVMDEINAILSDAQAIEEDAAEERFVAVGE